MNRFCKKIISSVLAIGLLSSTSIFADIPIPVNMQLDKATCGFSSANQWVMKFTDNKVAANINIDGKFTLRVVPGIPLTLTCKNSFRCPVSSEPTPAKQNGTVTVICHPLY